MAKPPTATMPSRSKLTKLAFCTVRPYLVRVGVRVRVTAKIGLKIRVGTRVRGTVRAR